MADDEVLVAIVYRGVAHDLIAVAWSPMSRRPTPHVRVQLKKPLAGFPYLLRTAPRGWIVPKKVVERSGPDGFKKADGRRRPLQVRLVQAPAVDSSSRLPTLLAQEAGGQALVFK